MGNPTTIVVSLYEGKKDFDRENGQWALEITRALLRDSIASVEEEGGNPQLLFIEDVIVEPI